ncbi:MAG: hypothetical protein GF398_12595 [Chitinivibrionales bacterium]|nr:hypothetical protein [Chitinivibrionales bacterium]
MQQPQLPESTSLREIDFLHYIRHYWGLLWRNKIYILISGPVVAFGALVYLVKFQTENPELPATVLIGTESAVGFDPMSPPGSAEDDKSVLMQSNNFLREIVKKLSLQLHVKDYTRATIFDSVNVDSTAAVGKYEFKIDREQGSAFTLLYTNKRLGARNRLVESGNLAALKTISMAGIDVTFNDEFLQEPKEFAFYILNMRQAVDKIYKQMTIEGSNPRRGKNHITVTLAGNDYELITQTVNAIADAFVQQNLNFRKRRTRKSLDVLKKQLDKAAQQLAKSDDALRDFLAENPSIALDMDAQQTVSDLAMLQASEYAGSQRIKSANELKSKMLYSKGDDKLRAISEVLVFLANQNALEAPVLQADLERLRLERQQLELSHAKDHPDLLKVQKKIDNLGVKVYQALTEQLTKAKSRVANRKSRISNLSSTIRGLPRKQHQLAELQRRQAVDSEIHSSVLKRYNEAKVSNAIEVADVYVMDYAVPPIPPPTSMLQLLGIAMLIGIAAALGPVILLDFIDKTARSEVDLKKMTKFPVLESIPVIPRAEESRGNQ